MSRTSASSVFGVFVPHESEERVFSASVGLSPALSRRRGEPAALRRGGGGPRARLPAKGAGRGRRTLAVPLVSGRPGQSCAGLCTAVPSAAALLRARQPRPSPSPRVFVVVGRCLSKIHTRCHGLARFLFESS